MVVCCETGPVSEGPARWVSTTHDWTVTVDVAHLEHIRADPQRYAPGGAVHLVLEVLAYAADEAAVTGGGEAGVTLPADGSIRVVDAGRGTDTGAAADGGVVKKPVMATRDLRFFDGEPPVLLPDGRPRRGMSVVAALSAWLVHTNRRTRRRVGAALRSRTADERSAPGHRRRHHGYERAFPA